MGRQRLVTLTVSLALVVGAIVYFKRPKGPMPLRVCTWSMYYPEELLKQFTDDTGIPVELSFISSNEELLAKMRAGATGFDVIQPSDYMVRQMVKLDLLSELDRVQLPQILDLDELNRKPPYDPEFKHSVPFSWGTTGLAVNTEKVTVDQSGVSWKLLFDGPFPRQTSLLDDMREGFSAALMLQGKSVQTKNLPDLESAQRALLSLKKNILMFNSEPKPLLDRGEVLIAHIFSYDALQAARENPKIQYFIPKEGAILWTDNFAIPKTSTRPELALQYIQYFLRPEVAVAMAKIKGLATPYKKAQAMLPENVRGNRSIYPDASTRKRLYFLEESGEELQTLNRLWTELKSL